MILLALFASLGFCTSTAHAANFADGLWHDATNPPRGAFRNISDRSHLPPSPNFMPAPGPGYGYGYPRGPGYGYGYEGPYPYGYRGRPPYVPAESARYGRAWIREIQRRLTGAGYDPGPADGIYGGGTKRAVRAYQRDYGLAVTGLPTPVLMSSLRANAPLAPLEQAVEEAPEDAPSPNGPAPRTIIRFEEAGIRKLAPVMLGDRLVTGYPITNSTVSKKNIRYGVQKRQSRKAAFDLAAYLDLVILRHWTELLDDRELIFDGQDTTHDNALAYEYANRFLTGDVLVKYVAPCGRRCALDRNKPFDGWVGQNEFEREDSYRLFLEEMLPALLGEAPAVPVEVLQIVEVVVEPYDSAQGGFPLRAVRRGTGVVATHPTAVPNFRIRGGYTVPPLIEISRDDARDFIAPLQEQNRRAYLAFDGTLDRPEWEDSREGPALNSEWTNPRLFLDADLQVLHHRFDRSSTSVAAAEREDKAERMDKADRIGSFDVVGISLDMPFDQAEALVRERMDVETVVESTSTEQTDSFLQDFLGFHSRDGKESIALFKASPDSNDLVAVVRMLDFPAGMDTDTVKRKLIEKYDESDPTNHPRYLVWSSSEEIRACTMALGWDAIGVVEGPKLDQPQQTAILRNGVDYGQDEIVYEELARECGPTLLADASGSRLIVALFDIGKYAERVVAKEKDAGEVASDGDKPGDLEL